MKARMLDLTDKLETTELQLADQVRVTQQLEDEGSQHREEEEQTRELREQLESSRAHVESTQTELDSAQELLAAAQAALQEQEARLVEARTQAVESAKKTAVAKMSGSMNKVMLEVQQQVDHWMESVTAKFERKIKEGEDYHGHQVHGCLRYAFMG
jgi:chromosome segregation ATPase